MIHVLDRVLDPFEADALRVAAAGLSFEDGRQTAGRHARAVKNNEQARESAKRTAILEKARLALDANPLVQSAARPRHYARMLVSRYTSGMEYGFHVDNAVMNGHRTDVSFTLCLSKADEYGGGELIIDESLEQRAIRLDAGQMVLYPSDTMHRVAPVTGGTRLAVVGWITSWVPDAARRAILFDLDQTAAEIRAAGVAMPVSDRLQRAKTNLLRMWAAE